MTRRSENRFPFRALCAALLFVAVTARAQDPSFHEAQLRLGEDAYRAGKPGEAIGNFRVAAFGFVNQPDRLTETLARLALAQHAARQTDGLATTLARFLETERRFGSFPRARLDAETRAAFLRVMAVSVPASTLAAVPSLSRVAPQDGGGSDPTPAAEGPGRPPPAAPAADTRPVATERPSLTPAARAFEPSNRGVVTAAGPAVPPAPEEVPPDEPARYRLTVRPHYPPEALRNRIGGTVLLRVLVSEKGEPLEITVLRQVHPHLSAAAVGAVRRWEFEPARRNGIPVAAWTTVPIPFRP